VVTTTWRVPRGLPAASFVLGGTLLTLISLTFDIQWHKDVGPDTFFTLPHLLSYSGSAVAGLASLFVVLRTTADERAGHPVDPVVGGRAVGVFGRTFAAPVGYLISGAGAASYLLYGLWDLWWHGLYGFDVTISSPPHIGLLLSVTITMVGAVMVFATAREQRWGAGYAIVGIAVLLGFNTATALGLSEIDGGVVDPTTVGVAFLSAMSVVMGARLLDRPGGALGVAAVVAVLQGVFWVSSPWATRVYADAIGLPMRDYVDGVPLFPSLIPMCLLLVAVVVELVLAAGRQGNRAAFGAIAGGVAGLAVGATFPFQDAWVHSSDLPGATPIIATAVAGAVFGLLGGFLGSRFGGMLRHLAPVPVPEGR
jgi:uncharacterized membrane protein